MQEPKEAKLAFKKLAYSNFKHYPLYLEWAPEDVFNISSENNESNKNIMEPNIADEVEENAPEENTVIFVKNLNFATTEDDLIKHFSKIGKIYSATIAQKKSSEGLLSMGYGFIQFYYSKHTKECIKQMQNSILHEHKLELKLSNRTTISKLSHLKVVEQKFKTKNEKQKQTGTKICVKNIPFEATVKDIHKIFRYFSFYH